MTRFQVVPASYVYCLRDGADGPEVLLQLRQHTGYMDGHWAAGAAGHVEAGETAYDAARREAREELAIEAEPVFEFCMQRSGNAPGTPAHARDPVEERIDFFFTARVWSGEPQIVEPAKCADLRWWPLDALPTPLVPHEAHAIKHLGGEDRYLTFGM
ncbi:NUDIX domain-containing protein [Nocardioides limicola]|uniref:NUDIX domain-containing protein n=1 Tax=Nocardioides limicola TaxID=2803368 RepID=UPI00193B377E|nr:NUDIX domain-containing protein [Nocardioides sp. DJM-14]